MASAWADWRMPDEDVQPVTPDIGGVIVPFFGAQVGWSPDREVGATLAVADDGMIEVISVCPVCGSSPELGGVTLRRWQPCGGCLRFAREAELAKLREQYPAPGPDPVPEADEVKPTIVVPERFKDRLAKG